MKLPPLPSSGPPDPGDEDPDARVARLTALALGQLSPTDASVMEASIWRDGEARRAVESTRALAEQLTFAYAAEPPTSLTPAQHRTIMNGGSGLGSTEEKAARLTAYALGELRPSQAEALSARLSGDRAATLELEAVGALATRLRTGFGEEPVVLLSLAQRQAILDRGYSWPEDRTTVTSTDDASADTAMVARARPRRWLQTAALAAGFAALGYVVSLRPPVTTPGDAVVATDPQSEGRDTEFFPPRSPSSLPATAHLKALFDQETRRPTVGARGPSLAATLPVPEPVPLERAGAGADAGIRNEATPRRQPDASILPPARNTLAQATGSVPASNGPSSIHQPDTDTNPKPLAGFLATSEIATATLPTDMDSSGYDVVRQCIRDFGTLPPAALVRAEEIINQFDYDVQPAPGQDFAVAIEAAACPWNESHQLVRVTVAARSAGQVDPPLRLTIFLRLAESAESERAQLLAWQGLQSLASRLRPTDSISLVVWGRSRGLVLPATGPADLENLRDAPTRWHQGGPALGPDDWATAEQALLQQATDNSRNLCLILTDGPLDFSGLSLAEGARRLRSMGAELTVAELGPLRPDSRTAALADLAGTPFLRADSGPEAARLLSQDVLTSRSAIAEAAHLEVAFNATALAAWRPLGFTSVGRPQATATMGGRSGTWTAGKQLTALYEVVPASSPRHPPPAPLASLPASDDRRFLAAAPPPIVMPPLSVHLRYRKPRNGAEHLVSTDWTASAGEWRAASPDFRLAAGAAAFALRLQDDHAVRALPLAEISRWVRLAAATRDDFGLRREFAGMLDAAERLEKAE